MATLKDYACDSGRFNYLCDINAMEELNDSLRSTHDLVFNSFSRTNELFPSIPLGTEVSMRVGWTELFTSRRDNSLKSRRQISTYLPTNPKILSLIQAGVTPDRPVARQTIGDIVASRPPTGGQQPVARELWQSAAGTGSSGYEQGMQSGRFSVEEVGSLMESLGALNSALRQDSVVFNDPKVTSALSFEVPLGHFNDNPESSDASGFISKAKDRVAADVIVLARLFGEPSTRLDPRFNADAANDSINEELSSNRNWVLPGFRDSKSAEIRFRIEHQSAPSDRAERRESGKMVVTFKFPSSNSDELWSLRTLLALRYLDYLFSSIVDYGTDQQYDPLTVCLYMESLPDALRNSDEAFDFRNSHRFVSPSQAHIVQFAEFCDRVLQGTDEVDVIEKLFHTNGLHSYTAMHELTPLSRFTSLD